MTAPLVTITFDEAKLAKVQSLLAETPGQLPRVMYRALNRTASSARVRIAREISSGLQLGVRRVQSRIAMQRATASKWRSVLGLSPTPFDLVQDFGAKWTKATGVRVRVLRGTVLELRRAFIPKADVQARRRGHEFLKEQGLVPESKPFRMWWGFNKVLMRAYGGGGPTFVRRGGYIGHTSEASDPAARWDRPDTGARLVGRLPVRVVNGPSLAQLWANAPDMVANIERYSQHSLEQNVDDQVNLVLRRWPR